MANDCVENIVPQSRHYDAIIIGAGPNGLAAAVTLARAGRSVRVIEAAATVGGGTRTAELTLPGFRHDVCSAVHPLALSSSFFRNLPLERYGLLWIEPPLPLAHPLDNGSAVTLKRSVEATAAGLGRDGAAYRRLMGPLVRHWAAVTEDLLGPLPLPNLRVGQDAILPHEMVERIEAQDARFAPGFKARILARHAMTPADFEAYNPNYVGGDIIGGAQDLPQFFARPVLSRNPYATPAEGIYLCSASTPPGGGVHGMCGYHAARAVLKAKIA